jgi:peptidyl-prolyl cis-trans isomerase D
VGSAFALQANKISAPIEGNSGVYVKKREYCKSASFKSHAAYVTKLKARASDANRVIPALKANAKIEDNRIDFSY